MRWVLGAMLLAASFGAGPACAATSAITDAFVAATTPAFEALRLADAYALADGDGARLRTFAGRDEVAQAGAAAALTAWELATQRADRAAADTPSIDGLGAVLYPFSSVVFPINVHGHVDVEAYRAALARLAAARGPIFDALYVAEQSSTLQRLVAAYVDYIKNGDDPGLRAIAVHELPRARRLLAELARL